MRITILFLFLMIISNSFGQTDNSLIGSWIRIDTQGGSYLKYTFNDDGDLAVFHHYAANGLNLKYKVQDSILVFGFNQEFLIEKIDSKELVLVERENGSMIANPVKHCFVREQVYLDRLPFNPDDKVLSDSDDAAYIESEKLYPHFENKNYPDFHLFIHDQIKDLYPEGENYFYATFNIRPDGKIHHINILHRPSTLSDQKVIKAIKKSEGMWIVPTLNGKKVTVVKSIEDRYMKNSTEIDFSNFTPPTFKKYTPEYVNNFHMVSKMLLRNNYQKALEYITKCEEQNPNEANLIELKSMCNKKLRDFEQINNNSDLWKDE